ncbi:iron ABC transporter permease [Amycolatopsis antarctica]|uniref:Iron ABC transporter permease n=1 Tax=Amycolatopsis antarctica TaxID=1854586 RepID=A0A263D0W9_9PSEU|nr:iron chelate uptake ABC transporter family permease subunit [Amycolatopsis antarctica]OZM72072.1 iron ABC transporter permease [Amycolatopsis antarctica]
MIVAELDRATPRRSARGARLTAGLLLAVAGLLAVSAASVLIGSKDIPVSTIADALLRFDPTNNDHLFIVDERLPRTAVGVLAGAALGLAGAILQAIARNPLADPGVLGINAGASLFVVFGINVFGLTALTGYVWFGFAGALAAAAIVYGVGSLGREGATPIKLALSGAATNAAFLSITTAVLLTDTDSFDQFRFWQVGSLSGRTTEILWQAAPFIGVGIALALASGRLLNTLSLGEDLARSLGQNVALARAVSGAAVVVLCGVATATIGPVGFVGLAVPQIARTITGPDHRWILPYSLVLAPVLLLGADILGRVIARPGEIQVGIVTALVGAPMFIALVRRRKVAEL